MSTQTIEEALEELESSGKNYHNAETFDSRLYWLKNLRHKATELKDAISETLDE